jgi:ferric-dicitrate binding protein FerR (iron transport regulator)
MNCETFRDGVFDFLEGAASPAFDAHRASCARCADILRGVRRTEALLRGARVPSAPPEIWERVAKAVARPPRRRWGPLAAAAALFLLGAAVLYGGRRAPAPSLKVEFRVATDPALAAFVPRYEGADAAPRNE